MAALRMTVPRSAAIVVAQSRKHKVVSAIAHRKTLEIRTIVIRTSSFP
jgi:predicted DNA-binding protein (UPF0251 family)